MKQPNPFPGSPPSKNPIPPPPNRKKEKKISYMSLIIIVTKYVPDKWIFCQNSNRNGARKKRYFNTAHSVGNEKLKKKARIKIQVQEKEKKKARK